MKLSTIRQEREPHSIENPTILDVLAAIKSLDAKTLTMVTLEITEEHHMGIGGGNGRYVVYMTRDNLRFLNLVDRSLKGQTLPLMCGGQIGEFDSQMCVDLPRVLRAAEFFALNGDADPGLDWEAQTQLVAH